MRTIKTLSAIILFSLLIIYSSWAEVPGSLPLLKLAPDARSAALGEAGTAGSTGAMAAFHNPALLVFSGKSQAAFAYSDWLLDLSIQTGSFLFSARNYAVGLSFNVFNTPGIERRVLPADDPIEIFSAHDLTAGVSFAYRIKDVLALGITARFLYQQIYIEEASGAGFDLGIAYRLNPLHLTLAASVRNLGKMEALKEEKSPLPENAALGIEGIIMAKGEFGLRGLADVQYFFDDDVRYHAGLEGSWKEHLFLRGGYQTGSELRSFSGGAGIGWKRYRFDYAYQPLAENFEASHRFALSIDF